MAGASGRAHAVAAAPGRPRMPGAAGAPAAPGAPGAPGAPAGPRKETLADVLRRRSSTGAGERQERSAAVHHVLATLTHNAPGSLPDVPREEPYDVQLAAALAGPAVQGETALVDAPPDDLYYPGHTSDPVLDDEVLLDVPLDELHANPFQQSYQFNRELLEELAWNLAAEGQREPVIARRVVRDGKPALEIVSGARTLGAAKICHATIRTFRTLKVAVRELTDREAARLSLLEILQQEHLTPREKGYVYWQLQQCEPRRWSIDAIAEIVHRLKRNVQTRSALIRDLAIADTTLRRPMTRVVDLHSLRWPAPERLHGLRAAIGRRLAAEQSGPVVDRPPAPRGNAAQCAQRPAATHGAASGGGEEAPIEVPVRFRRLRLASATECPAPANAQRPQLAAQRLQSQARIAALQAALREELQALQSAEHALAALPE